MKQYLPHKYKLKLQVFQKEPDFGKGIVQLMQLVEEKESLSAAYRQMGMAASKAWKILNRAEQDLGISLIDRSPGGSHGGHSKLTSEGKDLMERYLKFQQEVEDAADAAFSKYFN